jgi:hypothetical protein
MNEIKATKTLFKGASHEVKKGSSIFWQRGGYSENWQSWTIYLYTKINNEFYFYGKVTQRDFSREVQYMQDEAKAMPLH